MQGDSGRGAQPWLGALEHLEKPSRTGRKVRPNIAEEDDELAGKRAAAVRQFLDFIFLLPLLFSHTYMRLHYRAPPLPRSAMELSTRMSSLLLYDPQSRSHVPLSSSAT